VPNTSFIHAIKDRILKDLIDTQAYTCYAFHRMAKYRNKTKDRLVIMNVGVVEPEGTIETDQKLENINLEEITEEKQKEKQEK
jgi:hypothetical protein